MQTGVDAGRHVVEIQWQLKKVPDRGCCHRGALDQLLMLTVECLNVRLASEPLFDGLQMLVEMSRHDLCWRD